MPRNKDGTSWSADTARLALREIRAKAIGDLRMRDERLSQGRLNAANRYAPVKEVVKDNNQGSTFIVDSVLASIRHTGEDVALLTRSRWAAFTSEEQDEKPYRDKLLARRRDERWAAMRAAGQSVEDSLGPDVDVVPPVLPKLQPKKKEPALIG